MKVLSNRKKRDIHQLTTPPPPEFSVSATAANIPKIEIMSQHPRRFLRIENLLALKGKKKWKAVFPQNCSVLVMDCPWVSNTLATDHANTTYTLMSDQALLEFATGSLQHAFVPTQRQPTGVCFSWFTNDKYNLAVEMMERSGYQVVGLNVWAKTRIDRGVVKYTTHMGNGEGFIVGIKSILPNRLNAPMRTMRVITGRPYEKLHSCKPIEFYDFVQHCLDTWLHDIKRDRNHVKLELFSRHCMLGWISAGNQFYGERIRNKTALAQKTTTPNSKQSPPSYPVSSVGDFTLNTTVRKDDSDQFQVGHSVHVKTVDSDGNEALLTGTIIEKRPGLAYRVNLYQPGAHWSGREQLRQKSEEIYRINQLVSTTALRNMNRRRISQPRRQQCKSVWVRGVNRHNVELFWKAAIQSKKDNEHVSIIWDVDGTGDVVRRENLFYIV